MIDLLIVGGGPCGLAAAISAQRAGLSALVLEGASVVSTIAHYPTYVQFFSTAEKLSLGGLPFVVADREADAPRRAGVLPRRRAAFRDSAAPVRARDVDRARRAMRSSCTRSRGRAARSAHRGARRRDRDRLLRVAELPARARRGSAARRRTSIARDTRRSIRTSSSSAAATRRPRRRSISGARARA